MTSTRLVTQASSETIVLGESLVVSVAEQVAWSDGVTTFRQVSGDRELAWRPTGAGLWDRAGRGRETFEVAPEGPGDYRMVVDGVAADPVFVNVIRPTSAHRIAEPRLSAEAAIANSALEIVSTMETQYDDKQWRPSPIGTRYELQFLADGGTAWTRLLSSTVREVGVVSFRFSMLTSGRYRIAAAGATSPSVPVQEIVPVGVPAIEPLDLPTSVAPGEPLDVSLGVVVAYSDGEIRDAPDGTAYDVEFAPSRVRSSLQQPLERSKKLKWRTVKKGKIRDGQLRVKLKPKTSGYWRLRVGEATSANVFVSVRRK